MKYKWNRHVDNGIEYFTDFHPNIGGVPFAPECSSELKKGEIEHRGHATYYPANKRLVVTEQGKYYDDHGAVHFHCDTIEDAEMILGHIIEVTTH